jgi:shikimate dehydrogenase
MTNSNLNNPATAPIARYAVIGHPIAHSLSPRIHRAFAEAVHHAISYEALEAPLDGFEATLSAWIASGAQGANVTVPFKEAAWRFANQHSPRAKAAKAVNTLRFSGDEVWGDNTDGLGLIRDICHNLQLSLDDKQILLVGAGGAARGVILPILEEGPARLTLTNRSPERACLLVQEFSPYAQGPTQFHAAELDSLPDIQYDIVINATSASLNHDAFMLPAHVLGTHSLAYDMMYNKGLTAFAALARQQAARYTDGLGMLVEQAAAAFAAWRGIYPDTQPVLSMLRHEFPHPFTLPPVSR